MDCPACARCMHDKAETNQFVSGVNYQCDFCDVSGLWIKIVSGSIVGYAFDRIFKGVQFEVYSSHDMKSTVVVMDYVNVLSIDYVPITMDNCIDRLMALIRRTHDLSAFM